MSAYSNDISRYRQRYQQTTDREGVPRWDTQDSTDSGLASDEQPARSASAGAVAAAGRGASGAAGGRPRPPGPAAVGGRPLRPRPDARAAARTAGPPRRRALRDPRRPPQAAEASGEQVNGYQVIQQISERSDGAWRPSPGSVYPTIQQLQDEGLVETDDERGRKTLALTAEGREYVAEHADELAAVWRPFERQARDEEARLRRAEAGDRAGHGRGLADRHVRLRGAAARRDRRARRDPAQALRHPRRRRRRRGRRGRRRGRRES